MQTFGEPTFKTQPFLLLGFQERILELLILKGQICEKHLLMARQTSGIQESTTTLNFPPA
jgi:hypothetical protein